jgi:hypothetical protein
MEPNPYQASTIAVEWGGTRRIVGWTIFVPAAALTARVAWMAMTWENLSEEEANRIYVLGTLGMILMTCGLALIYSARRASKSTPSALPNS